MGFHPLRAFLRRLKHKKGNRYDHIFSLGYNCENAYKFVKYFQFEESNIFNWSLTFSTDMFLKALYNIEEIGTHGFNGPLPYWNCKYSGLYFHTPYDPADLAKDPALAAEDEKNLGERVHYLAGKFLKQLQSDDSKLYIRKIQRDEIDENIDEKIQKIYQALIDRGGKNFDLMIVSEEKYKDFFKNDGYYIYRTVKEYAPDADVTDKAYTNNGWEAIFDEFYMNKPKNIKKKKYKFVQRHQQNG